MAQYTVQLDANKTAMLDSQNANTNYSTGSSYLWTKYKYFCLGFEDMPSQYIGKAIVNVQVNLYATNVSYSTSDPVSASAMQSTWSESAVTFQNSPRWATLFASNTTLSGSGWQHLTYTRFTTKLWYVLQNGIVIVDPQFEDLRANFYTRHSSYPPYLTVVLEDPQFQADSEKLSPTEGFVGKNMPNTFTFVPSLISSDIVGGGTPSPDSVIFRWRPTGGSSTEITLPGTQTQYTLPAGTFSADSVQWQVSFVSGSTYSTSEWFTLTTVDSISQAEAVSPINMTIDASQPTTFRWLHIIETGSDQSKYELEYSDDNGLSWEPLQSANTKNTYAEVPGGSLPSGNILWRVRTYNSDGVAGTWSNSAAIVVRGAPNAPSITSITAVPRPVVKWQADGQQAFEVSVFSEETLIYTSGEIASSEKLWKVREYLPAGNYMVKVKIWNSYNLSSPYGSGAVSIPSAALIAPYIEATAENGYAEIAFSGSGFARYYVLRDGVPVAIQLESPYRDYAAVGTHSYAVRGVTDNDWFADSAEETINISIPYAMIAPSNDLASWVPLIYRRNADPNWSESLQMLGEPVFASGRQMPFYEFDGAINNTLSFVYSYRSREEYEQVRKMAQDGQAVRYRGKDGTAYWLALTGMQMTADYLSRDFTLSAQEIDYIEKVDYLIEEE